MLEDSYHTWFCLPFARLILLFNRSFATPQVNITRRKVQIDDLAFDTDLVSRSRGASLDLMWSKNSQTYVIQKFESKFLEFFAIKKKIIVVIFNYSSLSLQPKNASFWQAMNTRHPFYCKV